MKKLRDEQKGIIFISLIVLVIAAVSVYFAISLDVNKVEDTLKTKPLVKTLFVVEDGEGGVLFSNVFVYNAKSNKGALINIPGYTGQIYDTINRTDRIDQVYREKGIDSFKLEIERLIFGAGNRAEKIDYYSVIKLDKFIMLCDMLGGMRVFIPSPVDCYSETGVRWLLPSGAINLDGDKVATYLQYRDGEDEASVQNRYLDIMVAFLSGLHDKGSIILTKKNFKTFGDCIISPLEEDELKLLFTEISGVDTESLVRQTITGSERHVDNQILLLPGNNGEFIKDAVRNTLTAMASSDISAAGKIIVLEIQNGTYTEQLASKCMRKYQDASYNVLQAKNAERHDYEKTMIIDHLGNDAAAKNVGDLIRCSNIIRAEELEGGEDFSSTQVDFTIILGKDFSKDYLYVIR
ncbi:MAG: LCP family protein [Treponema sp.]|nr:LCP family protein [Treponema sp.]